MDRRACARATTRPGFTLLEVMAVMLLIGLVVGVSLHFYLDLSHATRRAADRTRGARRATAILDHVVRDLQGTVLVKNPPGKDPLLHPWVFLGQSRYAEGGSDQLKFVTRGRVPRSTEARESDLALVTYSVSRQQDDEGRLELRRSSLPHLPDHLDREFPPLEETQLLADGLAWFAVHFVDEQGERHEEWDSSQVADSGALPVAVEVELALAPDEPDGDGADAALLDELPRYSRVALLPLRPIDLEALLDPNAAGAGERGGEDRAQAGEKLAGGRDHDPASGGEGEPDGTLSAGEIKPGSTLGNCVVQLPGAGDSIVEPSYRGFIDQNPDRPLVEFRQLFRRENISPDCLL